MTVERPVVERTVFATSRAAEFLELRALQAQTGQPEDAFGDVVVKELLDNALDAAESAGRSPVVEVTVWDEDGTIFVAVSDNGDGISTATVDAICDFGVTVSDKARYRGPSRGAQGNALKTVLGIPYALGITEPVAIESRGVRHELRVGLDRTGDVVVSHETSPSDRTVGTAVTVPLPDEMDVNADRWALGAAFVNPHATITDTWVANSDYDEGQVFYKPTVQGFAKWTPSMPSSPWWYDLPAFSALIHSHIRQTSQTGVDVPLGRFISEFDGLTGSAKQQAVRSAVDEVGSASCLTELADRDDAIYALHRAMKTNSKPTAPARLGPVGGAHLRQRLDDEYGVRRFWYKSGTFTSLGVPWVIEVAVADTEQVGRTWFGVNHSPAFGDPLANTRLNAGDIYAIGAASLLAQTGVLPEGNFAAVVHVLCASAQFTDKGKVVLVVPTDVGAIAAKTLSAATAVVNRERKQRLKDARAAEKATERARTAANRDEWNLNAAVFEVLAEAKQLAGAVAAIRTLFYKVRPMVQKYTRRELKYDYFSQTLVPEYERTVGPLTGLYYKARGELIEPHGGAVVKLGTREVEDYTPPEWAFDKVLYIEKEGLSAQLAPYQLGQRYDLAIISGEGYSPVACRRLLAMFSARDIQLFVLHDGDAAGYDIARTLGEATKRMPDHNIEVIDLGLTVPQAIELGLETEQYTRKKALPADLELDADAQEWFTGVPLGRGHYSCTRCELNAFSADELAEFIEDGLRRHGANEKLVAPEPVLAETVQEYRRARLTRMVEAELDRIFDIDGIVDLLDAAHPDMVVVDEARVRERFVGQPEKSWRSMADTFVAEDIDAADLLGEIRTRLTEQLAATPERDDTTGDE